MSDRREKLFTKAEAILDGRALGLGEPILRHFALRGYGPALLSLANRNTRTGDPSELGRFSDPYSPAGMMVRAFRLGEHEAGQNLAMTFWNMGNLAAYRHWLSRAAKSGDIAALAELRRFEIRKPHSHASRLRRQRPYMKSHD